MAGERERHRAEHDAGHEHGYYDADGAQNAGQHHMIQSVFRHCHGDTSPFQSILILFNG